MFDQELSDFATQINAGSVDPNSGALIEFYEKAVEIPSKTKEMGTPQYETIDYVRIRFAGVKDFPDRPVREEDKVRYPTQWAAHKNKKEGTPVVNGMPIEQWTRIDRAKAESLKATNFFTVEQVASATDSQVKALGFDGFTLREQARAFIEDAKGGAATQRLAAKSTELEDKLELKNKELETQRELIERLSEKIDALESKKSTKKVKKSK